MKSNSIAKTLKRQCTIRLMLLQVSDDESLLLDVRHFFKQLATLAILIILGGGRHYFGYENDEAACAWLI